LLNQSQKKSKLALTRAKLRSVHSELSYGLSFAPKLQRVGSIHIPGWDQGPRRPTHPPPLSPDPSFSRHDLKWVHLKWVQKAASWLRLAWSEYTSFYGNSSECAKKVEILKWVYASTSMHLTYYYKLAAPRIVFFFGQHLSRDYWPPGHENPAMGFFWGVD